MIIGNNININNYNFNDTYIIGVDRGALFSIENNLTLDLAIGDFDSINKDEFELVKSNSKKIIVLNCEKDATDTDEAIIHARKISDDITIYGGIQGKRIEHFISNINLLCKNPSVKLIDNESIIFTTDTNLEFKKDEFKFISFFAIDDAIISLKGFKYPLDKYDMKRYDSLGISNEIISDAGLIIEKGRVLVIKSMHDIEI